MDNTAKRKGGDNGPRSDRRVTKRQRNESQPQYQQKSAASNNQTKTEDKHRRKLLEALKRACPSKEEEKRASWATELVAALRSKHRGSCTINSHTVVSKAMFDHARSIASNLKRNNNLCNLTPNELVELTQDELAKGTKTEQLRAKARLGGWHPPLTPSVLSSDRSAWHQEAQHQSKRLVLVLRDETTWRSYHKYFGGLPRVDVIQHHDITDDKKLGPTVDAYVSPANSMGNMDGGIDRAYADHFGWSYGRPYHSPNLLQLAIDKAKGEFSATLPIGEAILVRDGRNCLIAAPTMALPGKIKVGSRIVYDATRAVFALWASETSGDLNVVRMPAFGTGWPGSGGSSRSTNLGSVCIGVDVLKTATKQHCGVNSREYRNIE